MGLGRQLGRTDLDLRILEQQLIDSLPGENGGVGNMPVFGAHSSEKHEIAGRNDDFLDRILLEGQKEVGELDLGHLIAIA